MSANAIRPTFSTARGVVAEWYDQRRSHSAAGHYARQHYAQHLAYQEAHPGLAEKTRRAREILKARSPGFFEEVHPSPDVPEVWEIEAQRNEVRVLWPSKSLTLTFPLLGENVASHGRTIANSGIMISQSLEGSVVTAQAVNHYDEQYSGHLDVFCYGPHSREALALLEPRCFFHGREPIANAQTETTVLGRAATVIPLKSIIPLTDPRILGDALTPTVFDETEHSEVIVDRERQVILEWRALFEGEVYERHFFTEIAFDVPMNEADFDLQTDTRS